MPKTIEISKGFPSPLGLSIQGDTANFALYSSRADRVFLALFSPLNRDPEKEFPLEKTNDVWHIALRNIPPGWDYAFRCEGPFDLKQNLLFYKDKYLADPYAQFPHSPLRWNDRTAPTHFRSQIRTPAPFDWQNDKPPRIPYQDLIIYEMHVRGFTQSPTSQTRAPGTYAGLIEKIPHLKKLGVNAAELLPLFDFDETHCKNIDPKTNRPLVNYWGYNPLHFFAPTPRYAADPQNALSEFKTLVRELHNNGIEVLLDVVYNHTGEGKEQDYAVSFRGLDNKTYYMVDPAGHYRDYTGCGNTLNCNHPIVQKLILDSLRYWVRETHVDGFRFDLASIFTRGMDGKPIPHSPLIQAIETDPLLKNVKLIAEAWDAAGLYQIGTFPKWGPWTEWNGRYRDAVRRFIKGTDGQAGEFATALSGSQPLYPSPLSSINFVTAHDGYSLRDLVTYQQKHNVGNGESNRDGSDDNQNWNCGVEGPSNDPAIQTLRERQIRNHLLALFLSQGVPMLHMGDEYGHTRLGNNNPYVQDNEINWFLWDRLSDPLFAFTTALIAFRKAHPQLRRSRFLLPTDVDWHGAEPFKPNWSSRLVAYTLKGTDPLYIAFSANTTPITLTLPPSSWRLLLDTSHDPASHHLLAPSTALPAPSPYTLAPYSALILQG